MAPLAFFLKGWGSGMTTVDLGGENDVGMYFMTHIGPKLTSIVPMVPPGAARTYCYVIWDGDLYKHDGTFPGNFTCFIPPLCKWIFETLHVSRIHLCFIKETSAKQHKVEEIIASVDNLMTDMRSMIADNDTVDIHGGLINKAVSTEKGLMDNSKFRYGGWGSYVVRNAFVISAFTQQLTGRVDNVHKIVCMFGGGDTLMDEQTAGGYGTETTLISFPLTRNNGQEKSVERLKTIHAQHDSPNTKHHQTVDTYTSVLSQSYTSVYPTTSTTTTPTTSTTTTHAGGRRRPHTRRKSRHSRTKRVKRQPRRTTAVKRLRKQRQRSRSAFV